MAYNYGNLSNQAMDSMLPLFTNIVNGAAMSNQPSFINQLAAVMTTASAGGHNVTPTSTTSVATNCNRDSTPEPPPAPKFTLSPPKPNQGTAPMDLENDMDMDIIGSTTMPTSPIPSVAATAKPVEKMSLSMHDPNLYLNGLMPAGVTTASGYMFFPTTAADPTAATTTANPMLMDPSAVMAAMQQMQQSYAGYALAAEAAVEGTQLAPGTDPYTTPTMKEVIKTKSSILFPPNPTAPPPSIRERPPGCRTVFVGGLPENITEEMIREIFESCGEITTLRMSKKNFCHIRYRHEASIDRAIYLSGYRVRISNVNEPANFGRLHVDYAQARDDQYDYECKQRQVQREQRHRERTSFDRLRSQSPPPMPHYSDHEASLVAENLRNNETFVKAVQTIAIWLERGDCTKRNANIFYSMIQSTHAHVRRLHTDKQQLEEFLRKAREGYRKQMLTMSTQFTQIEKVFSAASHKKVWDHFTKAQRKNIDQWKKLASELRSIQIEDDEMEMSDDDRDYQSSVAKRARYDSENLKEENDSLRCQLEAVRSEMSLDRTDIKYNSDFREKQIKVLQETIRNMQTQLLQTKTREIKDARTIEQLERRLKESSVKELLLKTKIKRTKAKLKDKAVVSPANSDLSEKEEDDTEQQTAATDDVAPHMQQQQQPKRVIDNTQIIDVDVYKSDDDVKIIEQTVVPQQRHDVVEIHEVEDDEKDSYKEAVGRSAATQQQQQQQQKTINPPAKPINKKDTKTRTQKEQTNETTTTTATATVNIKDIIYAGKAGSLPALRDRSVLHRTAELKYLAHAEAKIIALAAAYLVVHPFGVSSESISTYLNNMMKSTQMQTQYLEDILKKHTHLFKPEVPLDAAATVKWIFCGFVEADCEMTSAETT